MSLPGCVFERWSPQIGDPTAVGWLTFAAYAVAGLLCLLSFARSDTQAIRRFGKVTGVVLLLLMVNKQLDLQSALTAFGRCLSQAQGWYEDRRMVQAVFIGVVLVGSSVTGALIFAAMRRHVNQLTLALAGVIVLLIFITVRAVGFHHIDDLIDARIFSTRMIWILEPIGIALIAANAVNYLRLRPGREER